MNQTLDQDNVMIELENANQKVANILRTEYIGAIKTLNEEEMQRIEDAVKVALRTYNIHVLLGKAIHEKIEEAWDKKTNADLVLSLEDGDENAQEIAHCSWRGRARNAATSTSTASWPSGPVSGDVPERAEVNSVRWMGGNSGARDRSDPEGCVLPGARPAVLII